MKSYGPSLNNWLIHIAMGFLVNKLTLGLWTHHGEGWQLELCVLYFTFSLFFAQRFNGEMLVLEWMTISMPQGISWYALVADERTCLKKKILRIVYQYGSECLHTVANSMFALNTSNLRFLSEMSWHFIIAHLDWSDV